MSLSNTAVPHPNSLVAKGIVSLSSCVLWVERKAIAGLMFLLVALILLNVVTRYSGASLYWVDESAVYSVVWLTFIGASAMTRLRLDFAVTLLTDYLSNARKRRAKIAADLGVIVFAALLGWMCWQWLDPVGLAQAGFDAKQYAAKSFNFVYTERTQTLNWSTWIMYLILPLFSLTMLLHGLANLIEDLDWAPRTVFKGFTSTEVNGIN
jgi:TRAP-type C4-dicarboxylate transport system permease small subunit